MKGRRRAPSPADPSSLPLAREFDDAAELRAHLDAGGNLEHAVLQGIDLRPFARELATVPVRNAVVLGGAADPGLLDDLRRRGAVLFPSSVFADCVFDPYPSALYTPERLILDDYRIGEPATAADTLDARIHRQYVDAGGDVTGDLLTSLARRLHDHGMTDAIAELIAGRRVIAIMGGHGLPRASPPYREVVELSAELTRRGYLVASGGGPGAMEAAHLGAFLSDRDRSVLDDALGTLAAAPTYRDELWQDTAARVYRDAHAAGDPAVVSLGIPTWHYGHEPPTVFASHIAKYFDNSVREDGLLRIADAGVVFAPGSAGTIQEVFQDAAQNHYSSHEPSPMVFLGVDYWRREKPAFPLVLTVAEGRPYAERVTITDGAADVVRWIERWSPVQA